MGNNITALDIVQETLDEFDRRKIATKNIRGRFKDAANLTGIHDEALFKRTAKVLNNKGKDWLGGNPLVKDTLADKHDPITGCLQKLVQIVSDLTVLGKAYELDDYINALKSVGISLDVSGFDPPEIVSDYQEAEDALTYAYPIYDEITNIDTKIKEEHAQKAEDLGFGPSKEYLKLCKLYAKKKAHKNIDEEYQNINEELLFKQLSYADVQADTIGSAH